MKIEELLPIGSVIWLKDAQKPLMIFGVMQEDGDTHIEYDYIGVVYPEGNMGVGTQFLFMHKDIEKVIFRGYEDTSREEFIKRLDSFYNNKE